MSSIDKKVDDVNDIPEYIQNQFENSVNLGECKKAEITYEELRSAYSTDKENLTKNLLRVLYGNDDEDMVKFQCIKECNDVLFAKINDTIDQVNFADIKPMVLKDLGRFVDNTLHRFDPGHKMWKYSEVEGDYTEEEMVIVEQLPEYFDKPRNNAKVKRALYEAIKSIKLDDVEQTDIQSDEQETEQSDIQLDKEEE